MNNVITDILNFDQFVYENLEVKLTGRTATRDGRSGATITLVEITPVDPDVTWKKWVNPVVLYKINSK